MTAPDVTDLSELWMEGMLKDTTEKELLDEKQTPLDRKYFQIKIESNTRKYTI